MKKLLRELVSGLFLLGLCVAGAAGAQQPSQGKVYVILWFDTEDYILPQSDDAAKRLAVFLTQQGVRATFKVVGEKARVLERRGRRDVIAALAQHEIGYHTDTHSQHPTPAEYAAELDWDAGAREFDRRERAGFDDVRRIFGQKPTCYGQPGSSWIPQAFPVLKKWGVKVYLDEGRHVGMNGKPFWYGGLLNIFNTSEGSELHPDENWSNVAEAKLRFQSFYLRMTSRPEGGIISWYFHPCEFVHREFWDGVNFARGANPPPEEWKLPPTKTPEESERAFRYLEELVVHMKSFPRVEFITASQALSLFRDSAQRRAYSPQEIAEIARQVDPEVSFQTHDDYTLAASEVFYLLSRYVASVVRKEPPQAILLDGTPYGPTEPSVAPGFSPAQTDADLKGGATGDPTAGGEDNLSRRVGAAATSAGDAIEVSWSDFASAVVEAADFVEKKDRIPSAVRVGEHTVSPESFFVALAHVANRLNVKAEPPASVPIVAARLAAAQYVAEDSPDIWGWVIFPPGFRAPKLMTLARWQAWTLKPAITSTHSRR